MEEARIYVKYIPQTVTLKDISDVLKTKISPGKEPLLQRHNDTEAVFLLPSEEDGFFFLLLSLFLLNFPLIS